MSNSTQRSSKEEGKGLFAYLKKPFEREVVEGLRSILSMIRKEYGYVKIYSAPTVDELVASAITMSILEMNEVETSLNIYGLSKPEEDEPTISIGVRTKGEAPIIEIVQGPPSISKNKVSFWIEGSYSSIIIKLLEELFLVKDDFKLYALMASFVEERDTESEEIFKGLDFLVASEMEEENYIKKTISIHLFEWKEREICEAAHLTLVPYFKGINVDVCKEILKESLGKSVEGKGVEILADTDLTAEILNVLTDILKELSKRERKVKELISHGFEVNEEKAGRHPFPNALSSDLKTASYMLLPSMDLELHYLFLVPMLMKRAYWVENAYFDAIEDISKVKLERQITLGGRKAMVFEGTIYPNTASVALRDLGLLPPKGVIPAFKRNEGYCVPLEGAKLEGFDVLRLIDSSKAKLEKGCLTFEGEEDFKNFLAKI